MTPIGPLTLYLFMLVTSPFGLVDSSIIVPNEDHGQMVPMPIRQGPLFVAQQNPQDYYWYQVGAIGTQSSYYFVGANITIRTVYDEVNNDAHSYWVGGFLSNGAFIQVGFLNGVSTTGQPYCCAWFYEYFPVGQDCCDPVIGPARSAGPMGSWHTYSMVHMGVGVWSFYMDGKLLGSTPPLGATHSGENAPASIAEVAQATSNTDILGPGEFKDLQFRSSSGNWQPVPSANNLIWYGQGTPLSRVPPNPYGVWEVNGVDNNFLAGSRIPQLSGPAPPPGGPSLWPVSLPPNQVSFFFLDTDQQSFKPEWVSLRSPSNTNYSFFTDSGNYETLRLEDGTWIVDRVMWHTVDVTGPSSFLTVPGTETLVVQTTVSSLRVRVVGSVFSLPIANASVTTFLRDTTNATGRTDPSGLAVLPLLPPGNYYLRITVPYGIPAITNSNVPSGEDIARVIGLAEMLMVVVTPVSIAVFFTILAVRREKLRAASMPTIPPSLTVMGNCANCGSPIHVGEVFCGNCRTPVVRNPAP